MAQQSPLRLDLVKSAPGPASLTSPAGGRRRNYLWLWPLVAAVLLGCLGYYLHWALNRALHERIASALITIRDADVVALRLWLDSRRSFAEVLAREPDLLPLTQRLVALRKPTALELRTAPEGRQIRQRLAARVKALGLQDYLIVNPSLRIVSATEDVLVGEDLPPVGRPFAQTALEGQSFVTRPLRSTLLLRDESGALKNGLPVMWAVAPILDGGKAIAVLGLRLSPEGDFTTILRSARFGQSGETYAFDANGLLLTQSRFDDDLKQIGLLADLPECHSILTIEIRDPGTDMKSGQRPAQTRSQQPLTRMARDAVAGNTGVDVVGYRDYRGVESVGAWTWLPEHELGVATEVDIDEAFQPLYMLRKIFAVLFGLLAVAAAGLYVFLIVVERQQRLMRRALQTVRQLGQYTLEKEIGSGGMGTVYRARHALLRRPTAVKLLRPDQVDEIALARFEREVQLTSQLSHPNTVVIYDYGRTAEGIFYYAMEYLDGISLEDLVRRFGPQPAGRVTSILAQVCGSLAEAHAAGLIHRDVKPANILLTDRGGQPDVVKVLDFGLIKQLEGKEQTHLTLAGEMAGTPLYMAPEAIEQPGSVDARCDLYGVGAVGYYLLTGTVPFQGDTVVALCMERLVGPPQLPSARLGQTVPGDLEVLIMRCLAVKPADRPASAEELRRLLGRVWTPPWTAEDALAWWTAFRQGGSAPATSGSPVIAQAHSGVDETQVR
jgi:tRNA A-37 threonylcarbamoyl transferase component Bud32